MGCLGDAGLKACASCGRAFSPKNAPRLQAHPVLLSISRRVRFKVGAGIQRNPKDRNDIDPLDFRRRRRKGKGRIRFTPWPHSKSSRIMLVFGVRLCQLSFFPRSRSSLTSAIYTQRIWDANQPTIEFQTSLKRVNSDKKNPKSNSLTIARHLPVEIRKLLVIKEANLE
jgi:hypothetical protein